MALEFDKKPIVCPCCGVPMIPEHLTYFPLKPNSSRFIVLLGCTNEECSSYFLAEYVLSIGNILKYWNVYNHVHRHVPFPEVIKKYHLCTPKYLPKLILRKLWDCFRYVEWDTEKRWNIW